MASKSRAEELSAKYGATKKMRNEKNYNCMKCCAVKPESSFYTVVGTKLWNMSNNHPLFCKQCVSEIFEEYKLKYGAKIAMIIACHLLDMPYSDMLFNNSIAGKEDITYDLHHYYFLVVQQ